MAATLIGPCVELKCFISQFHWLLWTLCCCYISSLLPLLHVHFSVTPLMDKTRCQPSWEITFWSSKPISLEKLCSPPGPQCTSPRPPEAYIHSILHQLSLLHLSPDSKLPYCLPIEHLLPSVERKIKPHKVARSRNITRMHWIQS